VLARELLLLLITILLRVPLLRLLEPLRVLLLLVELLLLHLWFVALLRVRRRLRRLGVMTVRT
jgi:hypothetical protein